ncbi:MAG: hypothetical protein JJE09_02065 [Bacteroidia bacterium]|nr:hypothetical protein [Bacteroidia bacterium]
MSRNEIRLRRKRLSTHGSDRFRNYGFVLKSHEQNQRLKKILKVFTFFAVILIVVVLMIILFRWETRGTHKTPIENSEKIQTIP